MEFKQTIRHCCERAIYRLSHTSLLTEVVFEWDEVKVVKIMDKLQLALQNFGEKGLSHPLLRAFINECLKCWFSGGFHALLVSIW